MVIPDGYTSAAILYMFLKRSYPDIKLNYVFHNKSKSHGLSEDLFIPEDTNLIICPDSASNDVAACKHHQELGREIICLDHHILEVSGNPYAIIVNNQCSENYGNKDLSAAGVVWQFCRAIDQENWTDYADDYLDLVMLGNIADSMSILSFETRRLIDKGMSQIKNKFMLSMLNKQSYSIGQDLNIISFQFYVVPSINGLLRFGSFEEKELLFRAFIETDESFEYKKKDGEMIKENIYDRASRICVNAKARQDREVKKSLDILNENIEKYHFDNNKVLFVNANDLDHSLTGLAAIKLANQYNRPCVVLRKNKDGWGGSARNVNACEIENLKEFLFDTGLFEYCNGHNSAFGVKILEKNLKPAIEKTNELLKDFNFEKVYNVDFIFQPEDITLNLVNDFNDLKNIWGQGLSEPLVVIENIKLNTENIQLMGADKNTWKFTLNEEGTIAIKFKCDENDKVLQIKNENWNGIDLKMNCVGKLTLSNFNGIISPQFIINDYNII
jgi:single-stranded-DNA-specific exonuclease